MLREVACADGGLCGTPVASHGAVIGMPAACRQRLAAAGTSYKYTRIRKLLA